MKVVIEIKEVNRNLTLKLACNEVGSEVEREAAVTVAHAVKDAFESLAARENKECRASMVVRTTPDPERMKGVAAAADSLVAELATAPVPLPPPFLNVVRVAFVSGAFDIVRQISFTPENDRVRRVEELKDEAYGVLRALNAI